MLLAQLSVLDATVVSVVNEGGKYNRHECHRVRGNSVRVVVHSMGRFCFRVQVWGGDPLGELVDAHGYVTCMLKVAAWVLVVTCGKQSLAAHNDMPRNIDFRRVHLGSNTSVEFGKDQRSDDFVKIGFRPNWFSRYFA